MKVALATALWLLLARLSCAQPTLPAQTPDEQKPQLELSVPVDLDQALKYGLSHHPSILAASARLRAAYWTYEKSTSLPSAQLTLGSMAGTNVPGSQPGGNNPSGAGAGFATFAANGRTDNYLQVSQPFLPFGAQSSGERLAESDYLVAQESWRESRVTLRKQLKDAYYTLLAAQATRNAMAENLLLAEESYQIADRRLNAGAGPKIDLLDAGVQVSRARQDSVKAETLCRQAQVEMTSLLTLPVGTNLVLKGELALPEVNPDYQKLLEEAQSSPRLRGAQAAIERSQASVDLAQSQANPAPLLSFVRDFTTHTHQVQIGLQFPFDWGQIRSEVESKRELLEEQKQNLVATKLTVSSGLQVALEQYIGAVRNATEFREKILVPSQDSTRITQYGFKRGAVPYLRLLASQQTLTAVRKEYIALLHSAWIALDTLEATIGRSDPGQE